jgi:uncharacterized protein (DUF2141 family)
MLWVILLTFGFGLAQPETGTIVLAISPLDNTKGLLRVSLFKTPLGFPNDYRHAARTVTQPADTVAVEIELTDLPASRYAISVLHDQNSNGQLDSNWLGMPKEPWGVSNNIRRALGPPRFKDASFVLKDTTMVLDIQID